MYECFRDYAKTVKPLLDEAYAAHLKRLLGDSEALLSPGARDNLNGGKKIRGILLCLVAETLGGDLAEALPRAVAVELIQAATLIHDDYVDQHHSRRNVAAIWTLEGSRRAVLLGDIVFASAIHMMSEMGREDGLIVSRAIADVSQGAWREPMDSLSLLDDFEAGRVDPGIYEYIIYLKTAVLFEAACRLGAVAAGASEDVRTVWSDYGRKIGEAYQMADDLQEVERCLESRCISSSDVSGLAPALLYFARESRPILIEMLRRRSKGTDGEMIAQFRAAAEMMKAEIERRLLAATDRINGDCRRKDRYRLAGKTPRELIRMFDETDGRVSSP